MAKGRHGVLSEGADVGIVGGLVVAIWFLVLDTIAGHPMQTPSVLGQVVLFGEAQPVTDRIVFGAVVLYTAFHFLAFVVLGMLVVGLVHLGERNPVARYALVPLFLALQVMLYGAINILELRTELFPFWTVLTANVLAAVAMGIMLWVRHPEFRSSVRETPLGDAPMR